ncbi:MAG: prephenate dehydratase domain-containing protein [Myxococcota bacterium]
MSDPQEEFARIREAIEAADRSLVEALDERSRAMRSLSALYETDPDGYYALPRDRAVIERARERIEDFPSTAIEPVFREILAACDHILGPKTVAYVGPEGGFGHVAARRHFGAPAVLRAVDTVAAVIEEVARGRVSFGVLPLETSSEGAITATLHGLAESDVKICAERVVPSSYHLFSRTGDTAQVDKVHGTAPAIAACEHNLRAHFPRATIIDVASGEAAAQATRDDDASAALGTDVVGELYGLVPVRERMEDVAGIDILHGIVGNDLPPRTGSDRTVLAMAVQDSPGALYQALQPFANRGINLTRLESRPAIGKPWKYLFFVEMDGHVTERSVLTAIDELRDISRFVKILGSHPRSS